MTGGSAAARRPSERGPRAGAPPWPVPRVVCCRALLLVLALSGAPTLAQPLGADPTTGGRRIVEEMRNTVRPREDYLRSAMIVVRTDPPGCEAAFARDGAVHARPVAAGREGNTHHCRVFDLPPRGAEWQVRIAKPGYRATTLTLLARPRTLVEVGVILASEFEADRILYPCAGAGGSAIACVLPDGSDRTLVVDTPEPDSDPAVNPDGLRVAFASGEPGHRRIRVLDRSTGVVADLTSSPSSDDHRPGWLDGETLVFERVRSGASHIMIRAADGRTREVFSGGGVVRDPTPYPERGAILVATDRFGEGLDIAEGDPATGELTRLTDDAGDETEPCARPGVAEIAYVAAAGDAAEVRARPVPLDPERPWRVLETPAEAPAWSADGRIGLARAGTSVRARLAGAPWRAEPVLDDSLPGRVAWGRFARLASDPQVVLFRLETGAVTVLIDPSAAPRTTERFLGLVDAGFYDGVRIHRVVPGQAVQLGCPYGNGTGGGDPAAIEASDVPLVRGALAPEPEADGQAATRLFFCLGDLEALTGLCSPFGRVVGGMEALDRAMVGDRVARAQRMVFDEADLTSDE